MQAVILAGGEGTRLRPLTHGRPKALIPVANRPIIEYTIDALRSNGIREIIVVVGYRKEQVTRYLNNLDLPIKVVIQDRQLGTAHALKCAEPLISGDFLLLPGDNYIDAESIALVMKTRNGMLVKEHQSPSNFGVVILRDTRVVRIMEKPLKAPAMTVSTGIFSLTPEVFRYDAGNDITDTIAAMLADGVEIRAIEAIDWQDAIYPWDILAMNSRLLRGIHPGKEGVISRNATVTGAVRFGKGTTVGPHAVISGPVVIGERCEIGSHTVISPNTSIGSRVRIEPFSFIGNSMIMDDVRIGSHSRITDAVIGEGCQLPDHQAVYSHPGTVKIEDHLHETSFGAILGDAVKGAPFTSFRGSIIGNNVSIRTAQREFLDVRIPDDALVV
ncbi:MAG: NTP transferase domain-containing protein [Methanoregulaceae archaeon]|nr:NTP transferase domain-containing protein [Methanoregulaceae archaeon]